MSKQVKTVIETPVTNNGNTSQNPNLYISVKTFDATGHDIGFRVVDMYHFGTRNWLQNHHWWAMHNGHCVEANVATEEEVNAYLQSAKLALAAKFNAVEEQQVAA